MKITYYGQSCFSANIMGQNLLFDPFISPNPQASHINVKEIKADLMFLSHGHADHVADAEDIAKRTEAQVYANFEIIQWLGEKGVKNGNGMNIGGKKTFEWGTAKMVNAIHSSALPDGKYGGNPGGWVINSNEGNFYFVGDSALTMDFELIGRFEKLDFALIPIGDNFTMGIDDAIICADMIKCNKVIGIHYDTFPPIRIDQQDAKDRFKKAGKELILLGIGEEKDI